MMSGGDISHTRSAHEFQFPANDMMSGGNMSQKRSAHEMQFPANNMMSDRVGR